MSIKYETKQSSIMLYILYLTHLYFPLKSLINSGIVSDNNKVFSFINSIKVNSNPIVSISFLIFLYFIYLSIKNYENEIYIIIEDESKNHKIKNSLIFYKLFIVLTSLFCITIFYFNT